MDVIIYAFILFSFSYHLCFNTYYECKQWSQYLIYHCKSHYRRFSGHKLQEDKYSLGAKDVRRGLCHHEVLSLISAPRNHDPPTPHTLPHTPLLADPPPSLLIIHNWPHCHIHRRTEAQDKYLLSHVFPILTSHHSVFLKNAKE